MIPLSTHLQHLSRNALHGLILTSSTAYILAAVSGQAWPNLIGSVLAFLSPAAALATRREWRPTPAGAWAIVVAIAFLCWMVVAGFVSSEANGRSWGSMLVHAAGAAALAVSAGTIPTSRAINILGLATSLSVLCCALLYPMMSWWTGGPFSRTGIMGYNQLNIFGLLVTPAIAAWLLWLRHIRLPRRTKAISWTIGISAALWTLTVLTSTGRRASLILVVAILLWLALHPLIVRWPRTATVALTLFTGLCLSILVLALRHPNPFSADWRTLAPSDMAATLLVKADPLRVPLYRLAGEAIGKSPFMGDGYNALVNAADPRNDNVRIKRSQEGWATQESHCEYLQRLAEGGPVALFLMLAVGMMMGWRSLRCPERHLALPLQILTISTAVSLAFHGIYQWPLSLAWTGCIAGICLARSRGSSTLHQPRSRFALGAAWVLAGACLLAAPGALVSSLGKAVQRPQMSELSIRIDPVPTHIRWQAETLAGHLASIEGQERANAVLDIAADQIGEVLLMPSRSSIGLLKPPGDQRDMLVINWLMERPGDWTGYQYISNANLLPGDLRRQWGWVNDREIPEWRPEWDGDWNYTSLVEAMLAICHGAGEDDHIRNWLSERNRGFVTLSDINWLMIRAVAGRPSISGKWMTEWAARASLLDNGLGSQAELLNRITDPLQLRALSPLLDNPLLVATRRTKPELSRPDRADSRARTMTAAVRSLIERLDAVVGTQRDSGKP